MARFATTIDVASSPEEAFAVLRDPVARTEWDPSVRNVAPAAGASGAVGDRYEVTIGFYGKAIDATYEIDELDEPRRIVFITDGTVSGRDVIEIIPSDTGAHVTLDLSVELKGIARVLDRGLQVAFAGIGENAALGVRRRLARS